MQWGVLAMTAPFTETAQAARNLLLHCAGLAPGDTLLIVNEPVALGYYDAAVSDAVAWHAEALGIATTRREGGPLGDDLVVSADLVAAMAAADCTVFFSRMGDQLRFRPKLTPRRTIIVYALDIGMLNSGFGGSHYQAFLDLKRGIEEMVGGAREIAVTCPLGTDFSGPGPGPGAAPMADVSIKRFPMSIFAPIPAATFSGQAAIAGFLVGTGSRYYEPFGLPLGDALVARFSMGRLTGFEGHAADVAAANAHYDDIAQRFGLDRDHIHSWHAGIHPGCAFTAPVEADYRRWSGAAFGNPRILHFHTCGAEPPGEICWNIVDPTIRLDGVAVWEDGRLHAERIPGGARTLDAYACAAALFRAPVQAIGIDTRRLRAVSGIS